ncbi:MAG: T9SS type A sorting domain-containing protein [Melioribacteraceae bacterium]|nr:T9SS type A sorting domain-containing protein [Melioribacteraceae bacterium]
MERLFIVLLVFTFFIDIKAQTWSGQTSGTTNSLDDVKFFDNNIGVIVGSGGIILHTSDGGNNWLQQTSNTTTSLSGISFINNDIIYVAGSDGTILNTTNGGNSWTAQTSNTTRHLYDIDFGNADNGIAVGFNGRIVNTTNGGTTWTIQNSTTINHLNGISFLDENTAVAVGDGGVILKTTDKGASWVSKSSGITDELEDVSFIDLNIGTAVGWNNAIIRTTDGGETWTSQDSENTNSTFWSVSMINANHAAVCGFGGTIISTSNGGATWDLHASGTSNTLFDIYFSDGNNGTAVGLNGTIRRTTNGALPIELISFTANINDNQIILDWKTATEINNYGFEIQRSFVGTTHELSLQWKKVGFVEGHGTSNSPKEYTFIDDKTSEVLGNLGGLDGKLQYRLKQIDFDGKFEYSETITVESFRATNLPTEFALQQNYPNPFNPTTSIEYSVPSREYVILKVYDVLGNEVVTLVNEQKSAGHYKVSFNAINLASGLYIYRIQVGEFNSVRKMMFIK